MKKRLISMIVTICTVISIIGGVISVNADAVGETFSDVYEIHWAYNAIERCAAKKWFSGYPDGTFRPDGSITRAEALKVFVTFLGEPLEKVTTSTYYDVDPGAWYASYIEAGKELFPKRTSLGGQVKFQPDMPVTREDVIYAMVVALGYADETEFADQSVLNMFSDVNSISSNVRAYAAVAVSNNFVAGHGDGTIGAQDPLTRAQFATLLSRASEIGTKYSYTAIPKEVSISPNIMQEMQVGETLTLSSLMTYSDDTTEDYSDKINPYTESTENILVFNKNKVTAIKEGTAVVQFNNTHLADKTLVIVVKDNSQAPVLNIDGYDPVTYLDTEVISGKVTDSTGTQIALSCGNSGLMYDSNGKFSMTVSLKSGLNQFTFKATNGHNKVTEKVIDIYKIDPTPEPIIVPNVTPEPKQTTPEPMKIELPYVTPTLPNNKQITPPPAVKPIITPTPTPTAVVTPTPTPKPAITPTPTPTPKITPTPTPKITPTPTPVPVIKTEPSSSPSMTANTSVSGKNVTVTVSYDGMNNANITSVQFVLAMDSAKYTYSPGTSISYFGGAAAYQKSRGGVRYVYSGSGIKSTSGTFAKLSFTLKDDSSFSRSDFKISGAKIVSNGSTYSGSSLKININ